MAQLATAPDCRSGPFRVNTGGSNPSAGITGIRSTTASMADYHSADFSSILNGCSKFSNYFTTTGR